MSRAKATKKAVELLSKFAGYNDAVKELESMLESLTDEQFDTYMEKLQSGEEILPYFAPNLNDVGLNSQTNLEIAEELGHSFFERLWITDPATGETYLTPKKYLVVDLPLRRMQQSLHKKINIPKDNRHIDDRTGQPTGSGESKGATLSFPELQAMHSHGLEQSIRELFKFRAGDETNYRNLERETLQTGTPKMDAVEDPDSRPKSTETFSILLKSAHIGNNL